jgi:hypothetical protein
MEQKMSRQEAIGYLEGKQVITSDPDLSWGEVRLHLIDAGNKVGYKAAFRALIMGQEADQSIGWQ